MHWWARLLLPAVIVAGFGVLVPMPVDASIGTGGEVDAVVTITGSWLRANADTWTCSGTTCTVSTSATEFPLNSQICAETLKATAGDSATGSCTATFTATITPSTLRDNICGGGVWSGSGQLAFHSAALNTDLDVPVSVTDAQGDATFTGTAQLPQGTATASGKLTPACVAGVATDVTFEGAFLLTGGTGDDPSVGNVSVTDPGPVFTAMATDLSGNSSLYGSCSSAVNFRLTSHPQPIKPVFWTAKVFCTDVPTYVILDGNAGTTETTVEVDPDDPPGDPSFGTGFYVFCEVLDPDCLGFTGASFVEESGSVEEINVVYHAKLLQTDPKVRWTWTANPRDNRCVGYDTPYITCLVTELHTV